MRYLLLADGPVVADPVRARVPATQTGDARIHVVVPTREISADERRMVSIENSAPEDGTSPEVVAARWRLRSAIDALAGLGLDEVTGDIGDARPLDALEHALDAGRYDAVIVVTRPIGAAGWVHLDLPHRIERHVDLPVIHIEVDLVHR